MLGTPTPRGAGMTLLLVMVTLALVSLVGGCGLLSADSAGGDGSGDGPGDGSPGPVRSDAPIGEVDPQVLSDVVSAAYTVPGPDVIRAMRVNAFDLQLGITECGGTPPPIDMTSDRFAQDLFPDLELIRTQGFSDEVDARDVALETVTGECDDLAPDLDAFEDWRRLVFDWSNRAETVKAESQLVAAAKPAMASCLRERSGLSVDSADPTTYLQSVNLEMSQDGTDRADHMRYAIAYADCGKAYFDAMATELERVRPALVEQNREVLQRYAAEIAAAGYVP